mmetsp:Transcript_7812/g.21698  ORF Transcript_7812/g.21698 Transcript_7812/m.21698 type:complete len:244 (-) Transcript_7812:69-800(-)
MECTMLPALESVQALGPEWVLALGPASAQALGPASVLPCTQLSHQTHGCRESAARSRRPHPWSRTKNRSRPCLPSPAACTRHRWSAERCPGATRCQRRANAVSGSCSAGRHSTRWQWGRAGTRAPPPARRRPRPRPRCLRWPRPARAPPPPAARTRARALTCSPVQIRPHPRRRGRPRLARRGASASPASGPAAASRSAALRWGRWRRSPARRLPWLPPKCPVGRAPGLLPGRGKCCSSWPLR